MGGHAVGRGAVVTDGDDGDGGKGGGGDECLHHL